MTKNTDSGLVNLNYCPVLSRPISFICSQMAILLVLVNVAFVLPGNTKGGSITVPLTSCLTGLESAVWLPTIFVFICKTD